MPLLQINTNVNPTDCSAIVNAASKLVADMLDKPESYVMVIINPDLTMSFGASEEASAHLKLKSLGLDEAETSNYSKQLCEFMHEQLGITTSRVYIEFDGPPRHMWGWDGKTF